MIFAPKVGILVLFSAGCMIYAVKAADAQDLSPNSVPNLTQPDFPPEKISIADRPHPEYDEVGYRIASYIVKPTISVTETFDSNILGSSSFERSDFFTSVRPTVGIESDWQTNAVSLYAEGNIARYARYTSENVDNFLARGNGRLDIERGQTLTFDAGYQIQHEARYSPESQAAVNQAGGGNYARFPTEYSLSTAQLTYVYSPSRWGF
ncbi:MAG: outer rane beta-barrel protein, partial [Rhodospirillales bacterium]|nr:outer rane beta-barrel protein [Rhodospirillales bacterium]